MVNQFMQASLFAGALIELAHSDADVVAVAKGIITLCSGGALLSIDKKDRSVSIAHPNLYFERSRCVQADELLEFFINRGGCLVLAEDGLVRFNPNADHDGALTNSVGVWI